MLYSFVQCIESMIVHFHVKMWGCCGGGCVSTGFYKLTYQVTSEVSHRSGLCTVPWHPG